MTTPMLRPGGSPSPTPPKRGGRLVPRGPQEQIGRIGLDAPWHRDLYHRLLTVRWRSFLAGLAALYLLINLVFAGLYLVQPGSILGARPGSLEDAFFFSVQTIATIGYGQMSPGTFYSNVLVTIETMAGLLILALVTGMVFARVSRPTARVRFARFAVVMPYNGAPTLILRIGNERRSQILEATVAVTLLRYEVAPEGMSMRRFYDLELARSHTPIFALTFSVMHTINESSPLWGCTEESLEAEDAELLITVTGLEEASGQTVHARWSYSPDEIRWNHKLTDIFAVRDGRQVIDYTHFHETEPL